MKVKERYQLDLKKPYRVICLEGDYSASFETELEAVRAKNRHQDQDEYADHEVVIEKKEFI
ncbi:hypothetical protein [Poritiphilus flavus]|uniref:Uncharacterized protein n=1 Tax=Poritiphilus flavus TaxID=2697053 RepID=A0A6L9EJH9_9FLAO|nr:hypothetical protein [Poritiphilus flavus]NAS14339.1 hypothetical protein [Poritiphilus flavus]